MENSEKLLELLQKEKLTREEQHQIDIQIQSDPELAKLFNTYQNIAHAVKYGTHLSGNDISEYIFYKNGIAVNNSNIIKFIPRIEEHLRICKKCEDEFKELNSEYAESESILDNILINSVSDSGNKSSIPGVYKRIWGVRFAFITSVSIILLFLSTVVISNLTKPAYYDLAKVTNNPEFSISRGRATDDFQRGIEAYDNENYNQAILFFDKDIKLNGNENTIFYTHYLLGLTYLESAQKSILGLFPHMDNNKIRDGIVNLNACVHENNTGEFQDINMNAYYYLSKAYLMEGNKEEAILCLKSVINGKGSKMDEAAKILNKLE